MLLLVLISLQGTLFADSSFVISPQTRSLLDPWWGRDKAWHFAVSHAMSNALESRSSLSCTQSAALTLGVGVAKELVDWKIRKTFFSWKDLVYDALGATLGCVSW